MSHEGHIDLLKFKVNPHHSKFCSQNAYGFGEMARIAYMEEAEIREKLTCLGYELIQYISRGDTQLFIAANEEVVIISFRGTEPTSWGDWVTDLDSHHVQRPHIPGRVHHGFWKALHVKEHANDETDLFQDIVKIVKEHQKDKKLVVTGHSLGAALATLFATEVSCLVPSEQDETIKLNIDLIYTFGSPRVGDADFAEAYNKNLKDKTHRVVNNLDIIPHMPPENLGFSHVGNFAYLNTNYEIQFCLTWWQSLLDRFSIHNVHSLLGLSREQERMTDHKIGKGEKEEYNVQKDEKVEVKKSVNGGYLEVLGKVLVNHHIARNKEQQKQE